MRKLESITIENFKSIRSQTLGLGALNVFIGANGAGKSNLIGVFRLLRQVVNQHLAEYTVRRGGADTLLHFGRKTSPTMQFLLKFSESASESSTYFLTLAGTDDDRLFVKSEIAEHGQMPVPTILRAESALRDSKEDAARRVLADLESYRTYHFHDTSSHAAVKATSDIEDNRFLRSEGENLAAFLYWMQQTRPEHLTNIRDTIRQIAPFFDDFQLAPSRLNQSKIRLEWKEKGSDAYFNASSLSDGTLRFICLATLLLQPELPALLLIDEPELGLHPAAINVLASLLSSAAERTQVIIATQSVTLVNQFEPEDVWTVDRIGQESVFAPLILADRSGWLDDYSLGELWEKNVLGARP